MKERKKKRKKDRNKERKAKGKRDRNQEKTTEQRNKEIKKTK